MPGFGLPIQSPPRRVVSLVPSMTESLFDLGLGACVVGVTDYCIHPASALRVLPRVGGPKDFRVEEILRLRPDLVIANQEENAEILVRQLLERSIPVWMTFPHSVNDALKDLLDLAGLFRNEMAFRTVRVLEQSVEYCQMAAAETRRRYFCPIWQEDARDCAWWMTFNSDTYSGDLLAVLGGENIFAGRVRKYPLAADVAGAVEEPSGSRDTRYPRVSLAEIAVGRPEYLVFPDEPYLFSAQDQQHLCDQLAELMGEVPRIVACEGSLITWPGTRISKALEELNGVFN